MNDYHHHRDHDVAKAIEKTVDDIIGHVLGYLDAGDELTRHWVQELVTEAYGNEMATAGLSLEQMLEAISEGIDITGEEEITFSLADLRSQIDAHAVQAIHWLAEAEAAQHFEDLFDLMDDNGLEPSQMRTDNPFEWLVHVAEREVDGAVVYEYRTVEELGNHVDVWEVSVAGHRIHFEVWLDPSEEPGD